MISRHILSACLAVAALAAPQLAAACAGGDCEIEPPPLVTALKSGKICYGLYGEGVPFLNPYNDTRVNLALLLQERKLLKLSLPPPTPTTSPPPGTLARSDEYPVPFRMETLRGLNGVAPDNPPPSSATVDLLDVARRLQLDHALVEEGLKRIGAVQTGRCAAESPATVLDFVRAVADETSLAEGERAILAGERLRMAGLCSTMSDPPQPLAVTTAAGQAFVAYLAAARHFYRDQLGDMRRPISLRSA